MTEKDFKLQFQDSNNDQTKEVDFGSNGVLFVVGSNGSGKSGLMHHFYSQNKEKSKRISAHRQTWFHYNTLEYSPKDKVIHENQASQYDKKVDSRWKDDYHSSRGQITLYNLIDSDNQRNRKITRAFDSSNNELLNQLKQEESCLKKLNKILQMSSIPIEISIENNDSLYASKNNGHKYSVAELSDGERNSLLIVSDVLTAPADSLLIIDEPEKHLHRSITSPLLSNLFKMRSDCKFIISTHDINLAADNPESNTLFVRNCNWSNKQIISWDTDFIINFENISDYLKKDILGSRRKIIFIEGNNISSLDLQLYQMLFPNDFSIVPKGNSYDVKKAVLGINESKNLHWIKASGIIDSDNLTDEEIKELKIKGIFPISAYSVESLYYSPFVINKIAERSSNLHGKDKNTLLNSALNAIIQSIDDNETRQRLCARVSENLLRRQVKYPQWKDIVSQKNFSFSIDLETKLQEEIKLLDNMITNKEYFKIICRYPIRDTNLRDTVAKELLFKSKEDYQAAVKKLVIDDQDTQAHLSTFFNELEVYINNPLVN